MSVLSFNPGLRLLTLAVFEPAVWVDNLDTLDDFLDLVRPGCRRASGFRLLNAMPAGSHEPSDRQQQKNHAKTPAKLVGVSSKT